jgi:hypothetical protein
MYFLSFVNSSNTCINCNPRRIENASNSKPISSYFPYGIRALTSDPRRLLFFFFFSILPLLSATNAPVFFSIFSFPLTPFLKHLSRTHGIIQQHRKSHLYRNQPSVSFSKSFPCLSLQFCSIHIQINPNQFSCLTSSN